MNFALWADFRAYEADPVGYMSQRIERAEADLAAADEALAAALRDTPKQIERVGGHLDQAAYAAIDALRTALHRAGEAGDRLRALRSLSTSSSAE